MNANHCVLQSDRLQLCDRSGPRIMLVARLARSTPYPLDVTQRHRVRSAWEACECGRRYSEQRAASGYPWNQLCWGWRAKTGSESDVLWLCARVFFRRQSWSRILEKLLVTKLPKFPTVCVLLKCITVFKTVCHLTLIWASSIHPISLNFINLKCVLIQFLRLLLDPQSNFLLWNFFGRVCKIFSSPCRFIYCNPFIFLDCRAQECFVMIEFKINLVVGCKYYTHFGRRVYKYI